MPTSTDELLEVASEKAGSKRDRSLDQIEASLSQIGDHQLELISVQMKAVADWSKQREAK